MPRRAGYVIDFIDEDRRHFEGAWNTIEDAAIRTLRSLDMHPEDPPSDADRRSIVDLVALHMVRGHGAQTYWEASRRRIVPERLAAVADGPAVREAAALAGKDPLAYAVSLTDGWEDQLRHGGRTFGEILLELLPSVASTLHSWDFTMVRSPNHDIIAPDVACVTVDDQAGRVGVLGGVGLNDTSRLLMPMAPDQVVVLRPRPLSTKVGVLNASEASAINGLLTRAAIKRAWVRPSGGSVEGEVAAVWRTQTDPPRPFELR